MLAFNTLTQARAYTSRAGAVWCVLSLEGARYYVFHSHETRDQVANKNVGNKRALHMELALKFPRLQATYPFNATTGQKQAIYHQLLPTAQDMAGHAGIDPDGRHAEEHIIESWPQIRADFVGARSRLPTKAEVFLSYCPCQQANAHPSPRRIFNGTIYPVSCFDKLVHFCNRDDPALMTWVIYYNSPFQSLSVTGTRGNLRIMQRPPYIPDCA